MALRLGALHTICDAAVVCQLGLQNRIGTTQNHEKLTLFTQWFKKAANALISFIHFVK